MNYGSELAGVNWKAAFAAIPGFATANAIALAWTPITGRPPAVINRGEYYDVVFDPEQEDRAAAWIVDQLNREPGAVRVEAAGIAQKVVMRQYWPYMLGLAAVGALLGYSMKGGR